MIDYIATILETIFFLIASAGFLSQKINKTRLLISLTLICVFKAIFLFLPATTQMEALSSFINILLGIVSIMILTKSGFKTSLSCYITGYIFAMLFQLALVTYFFLWRFCRLRLVYYFRFRIYCNHCHYCI